MTEHELQEYFEQWVNDNPTVKTAADVERAIYARTGQDGPSGELTALLRAAYGPDVLDSIEKLTVLLRAYFGKVGGSAAEAAAKAAAIPAMLANGNALDVIGIQTKTSGTNNWLTYTWNADGTCTVSGEGTSSYSYHTIYNSTTALPTGIKAGETYQVVYRRFENGSEVVIDDITSVRAKQIRLLVKFYNSSGNEIGSPAYLARSGSVTVPSAAVGMGVQFFCNENVDFTDTSGSGGTDKRQIVTAKILTAATNAELESSVNTINDAIVNWLVKNEGLAETGLNADSVLTNSIYFHNSDHQITGFPYAAGWLVTISVTPSSKLKKQFAIPYSIDLPVLSRYRNINEEWSAFCEVGEKKTYYGWTNRVLTPSTGKTASTSSALDVTKYLMTTGMIVPERDKNFVIAANPGFEVALIVYSHPRSTEIDVADDQTKEVANFVGLWDGSAITIPATASMTGRWHRYIPAEAFRANPKPAESSVAYNYYYRLYIKKTVEGTQQTITASDGRTGVFGYVLPETEDTIDIFTDMEQIPNWLASSGGYVNTTSTQQNDVFHSQLFPVKPLHVYYTANSCSISPVAQFFDKNKNFIGPLMPGDTWDDPDEYRFDRYNYKSDTIAHSLFKQLKCFVTPYNAAYISFNLHRSDGYSDTFASEPIYRVQGYGNQIISRKGRGKFNKKLALIGPSNLTIDGMWRKMMTERSRPDIYAQVSPGKQPGTDLLGKYTYDGTNWKDSSNNTVNLTTAFGKPLLGTPVNGDWFVIEKQYVSGLQEWIKPYYAKVETYSYSGCKTAHHDGVDSTAAATDGGATLANGAWDFIVDGSRGSSADLSEYDEIMILPNTQQSVLPQPWESVYDPNHSYAQGDYVYKSGTVYKAKSATTGTWDGAKWDECTFDTSKNYAKSDAEIVVYDGWIYRCCSDHTAGAFNSAHFQPNSPLGTAESTDEKTFLGATRAIINYYLGQRKYRPSTVFLVVPSIVSDSTDAAKRYAVEIKKLAEIVGATLCYASQMVDDNGVRQSYLYDGTHNAHYGNYVIGTHYAEFLLER